MIRYRALLAAVLLAIAAPAFAFDDDERAALAAINNRLSEIQDSQRAASAAAANPGLPDPTAMKPWAPPLPTSAQPVFTLPPLPAKSPPAMPLTFGKILDNPEARALGIEGMTGAESR